jgi:NADH-quinone oxidoreductase subunit C
VKAEVNTPKTTETPAQTGAGAPADKAATKEARKPRAAKARSEASKKPKARKP